MLELLGSGDEGHRAIERMDRRFAMLPGFARLRIYGQAVASVAA